LPLALDLLPAEWAAVLAEMGQPAYRARPRASHGVPVLPTACTPGEAPV